MNEISDKTIETAKRLGVSLDKTVRVDFDLSGETLDRAAELIAEVKAQGVSGDSQIEVNEYYTYLLVTTPRTEADLLRQIAYHEQEVARSLSNAKLDGKVPGVEEFKAFVECRDRLLAEQKTFASKILALSDKISRAEYDALVEEYRAALK